jgi:hypothetical protein
LFSAATFRRGDGLEYKVDQWQEYQRSPSSRARHQPVNIKTSTPQTTRKRQQPSNFFA